MFSLLSSDIRRRFITIQKSQNNLFEYPAETTNWIELCYYL